MRKLLTITIALGLVLGLTLPVYAINTVQMTLTSPAIVKKGCERVGTATFSFDGGTVIQEADWWYMDLPSGTKICKTIDYVLGSLLTPGGTTNHINIANVGVNGANWAVFTAAGGIPTLLNTGAGLSSSGPFSMTNTVPVHVPATSLGKLAIRVYAPANGQRVWMYVYGDSTIAGGGSSYSIPQGTTYKISILDGRSYQNWLRKDTGSTANMIYGDKGEDTIDNTGAGLNVPYEDNTLCVNAEAMSGDLMFTSFNSKDNKYTFTGDSQIAHVASATPISLTACKVDPTAAILIGKQGLCAFDFDTAGTSPTIAQGYCTMTPNRMLLKGSSTFGDNGDRYDLSITSKTSGVYINGTPTLAGIKPSEAECTAAGTAVAGAFSMYVGSTKTSSPPGTSCSVSTTSRVDNVKTTLGNITGIHDYNVLWIQMPQFAYDTTVIGNGVEAKITVSLDKWPCGTIFSGDLTLGTFVTTCPTTSTSATTTSLLYPWFPAMDGSVAGWWGGFVIVNAGSAAGTATLTFWETDGDKGTLTTPSIAVGGQYSPGALGSLISEITPDAANTGDIGDANFAITVICNFTGGGGFAFTGNEVEATGYTAYVGTGGTWN